MNNRIENGVMLDDAALDQVVGGRGWGGGLPKLIFRVADLFKKTNKVVSHVGNTVDRVDQKIDTIHSMTAERAGATRAA